MWTENFQMFKLDLEKTFQFNFSVVSDSLRPHGLQYAKPPCPSPTPRVYSNSCPSGQWRYDPMDVGNLICGSSAFSKSSLNIWKFSVHILLKPGLENFEHYFVSMWDECNCMVVWTFWHCLSLRLEWKLTFSSPVATAEFSGILSVACILLAYWGQHFHSIIF